MRTYEIALAVLLLAGAIWSLLAGSRNNRILSFLLFLNIVVLVWHLYIEGAHWQMAPAYLGVLVLGLSMLRTLPRLVRSAGAWTVVLLVLACCCFSIVLPMFRLPRPTGKFAIGTTTMYLVDHTRKEDVGPAGHPRELIIQIWYPANPSTARRAPYRRFKETTLLSSYQSVLWTHSRWDAPVATAEKPFPIVLFNPGWDGRRTASTYLVEELASHGFVVVGIDHTYTTGPVAFPDGRIAQSLSANDMNFDNNSFEQIEATAEKELAKQTADDIFVLNEVMAFNKDPKSRFFGRLDAQEIGAAGFSFGGAVGAQVCYLDSRIKAAVDLDGSLFGEVARKGLTKPFMFIEEDVEPSATAAELSRMGNAAQLDQALNTRDTAMFAKSQGYRIFLHGSTHEGYTDRTLSSPFKGLSGRGPLSPRRQHFLVRQYALAFFNQVLRGENSPLLQPGSAPSPDLSLESNSPHHEVPMQR